MNKRMTLMALVLTSALLCSGCSEKKDDEKTQAVSEVKKETSAYENVTFSTDVTISEVKVEGKNINLTFSNSAGLVINREIPNATLTDNGDEVSQGTRQANEQKSLALYQKLLAYYDSVAPEETDGQKYGKKFGGAYIDDNGLLNIMVVGGDKEELDVIRSVIGEKGYAVSSCTYSYAELIRMIDRVSESIPAIMDTGVLISSVGEDVKNNCVVIGIEGCTKEDENKVRAIVDAPYITFADEERAVEK